MTAKNPCSSIYLNVCASACVILPLIIDSPINPTTNHHPSTKNPQMHACRGLCVSCAWRLLWCVSKWIEITDIFIPPNNCRTIKCKWNAKPPSTVYLFFFSFRLNIPIFFYIIACSLYKITQKPNNADLSTIKFKQNIWFNQ